MKITLKQLTEWSACKEGVELFKSKCGESVDIKKFAKIAISLEKFDYAWWTIKHLLKKEQSVKIAIYTAEKVIDVFEKKYPNDDRPRKAIDAAKAWLKEPTETNRAANAADAANAAAYAANAANAATARTELKTDILNYAIKVLVSK